MTRDQKRQLKRELKKIAANHLTALLSHPPHVNADDFVTATADETREAMRELIADLLGK